LPVDNYTNRLKIADMSKLPPPCPIVSRFRYPYRSIEAFGGVPWADAVNYFVTGDIDGDGRIELVLCRGSAEQIAFDLDGRIRWHYTDEDASWKSRRPDSSVFLRDIDLDGKTELVCTRTLNGQEHVCLVDAVSGILKTGVPLIPRTEDDDNRGFLRLILADGPDAPGYIAAGWDYTRLALYDARLNLIWKRDAPIGHDPYGVDIDGDGYEEIVCGYVAFDRSGDMRWDSRKYLEKDSHADSVVAFEEDDEIRLFTSEGHILGPDGDLVDAIGQDVLVHGQEAGIIHTAGERRFVVQDRGDGIKQTTCIFTRDNRLTFSALGGQTMQTVGWGASGEGGVWIDTHGLIYDGDGGLLGKVRAYERGCWRLPTRGVGSAHDLLYGSGDELLLRFFDEELQIARCEIYTTDVPEPDDGRTPKTITRAMIDWSFY